MYFFVWDESYYIEDNFIEPEAQEKMIIKPENIINNISIWVNIEPETDLNSAMKYSFSIIPSYYKDDILNITNNIKTTINFRDFFKKIYDLQVEFYKDRPDVRGKMKDKCVKLFWPYEMWEKESLAIFIHEFAHFLDLYYLERNIYNDLSDKFYEISWDSTKQRKLWQSNSDFVSGYSMTNKYEDFAESFTYYILYNDDFLYKAKKSNKLMEKYNFFKYSFFKNDVFASLDFANNNIIRDYYRDITKIEFDVKKFLQYIEK